MLCVCDIYIYRYIHAYVLCYVCMYVCAQAQEAMHGCVCSQMFSTKFWCEHAHVYKHNAYTCLYMSSWGGPTWRNVRNTQNTHTHACMQILNAYIYVCVCIEVTRIMFKVSRSMYVVCRPTFRNASNMPTLFKIYCKEEKGSGGGLRPEVCCSAYRYMYTHICMCVTYVHTSNTKEKRTVGAGLDRR
jgi:hypothetical protein